MSIEGINNREPRVVNFSSMEEFIDKFDVDNDGQLSKSELKQVEHYYISGDVTKVTIDNVDYNLVTDYDRAGSGKKLKGTKGNDLIISTEADVVKTKGGKDIVFTNDDTKVKGKGATVFAAKSPVEEFATLEEFIAKFDTNGDGNLSKQEIVNAEKYFDEKGVNHVMIGGKEYNLIMDENHNDREDSTQRVRKGTKENDLILSVHAKKIKGKGGDDIIFTTADTKIVGGSGNDLGLRAKEKTEEFSSMDEFIAKFDADGDKVFSKEESLKAQTYFNSKGITEVVIGGVKYNLVTDLDSRKTTKLDGTNGNDLVITTRADVNTKGGDDVVFYSDGGMYHADIKTGKGNDQIYSSSDSATIDGGKGDDKIRVKGDGNKIEGGRGDDTVRVIGQGNEVTDKAGDDDYILAGDFNTLKDKKGKNKLEHNGQHDNLDKAKYNYHYWTGKY